MITTGPVKKYIPGSCMENHKGFTMIEVAFMLVIVGLLVSMGAGILPMLTKHAKLSENRAIVKEASTAILGYALANKRLPWPDTNNDGIAETGANPAGAPPVGRIPYITLGIRGSDAHLRTLYYTVDRRLALSTAAQFETNVYNRTIVASPTAPANPNNLLMCGSVKAAFAVYSSGENLALNSPNNTHTNSYFAEPNTPVTSTYDDILEAVSLDTMYERLTRLH